jgi:hypothetical protein
MTTATHNGHDTTTEHVMFMACALSENTWQRTREWKEMPGEWTHSPLINKRPGHLVPPVRRACTAPKCRVVCFRRHSHRM